jgi:glycosyltransferase involved in cell wall biosynthesis
MVAACPFPANHGTPAAIRELAIHLARLGNEVHVVTYPQAEPIPVDGLHIHRVKVPFYKPGPIGIGPSYERLLFDAFLVPKLIQVILRYRIDVIHAHNYEATIAGWLARLLTRRPLIYNGVTAMADELPSYGFIKPDRLASGIGKLLDRTVPRMGDLSMVLSDDLRDYLISLGNRPDRVLIVPPGVEMDWLSSGDRARGRGYLELPDEVPTVMYTGALEGFQRIDYLLQAMVPVAEKVPDAVLVIAGNIKNTKAWELYQSMATELGIAMRVKLVESVPLDQLPDYLAAADVTVAPRPSCPGFPVKLLNYMAAGRPIVSFEGSAKSLCHGYSGYVARNDDVEDFADGIALLLQDRELAEYMGRRAYESLAGVFDWETLGLGVTEAYRQLIESRKSYSLSSVSAYFKKSYKPQIMDAKQISANQIDGKLFYPSLQEEDL